MYKLIEKNHELEEKLRLKKTPTNSKNSSPPLSRDFKSEMKKCRRNRKIDSKFGQEKKERELVEKSDKVF